MAPEADNQFMAIFPEKFSTSMDVPFVFHFFTAVFALMLGLSCCEAAVITSASGVSLRLDASNGSYQLTAKQPAWELGGSLNQPLKNVAANQGRDAIGAYQQLAFEWQDGQTPMSGQIRVYEEKPLALFSQTCGAATEMPPPAFPDFKSVAGQTACFQLRPS